jgi:hypothetical protein
LKQTAPSTWLVLDSENPSFDAEKVDGEVKIWEQKFPDDWKIALTVTEFLINSDFRKTTNNFHLTKGGKKVFKIPSVSIIGNDDKPLQRHASLPAQRHVYGVADGALMWQFNGDFMGHFARFMHTGLAGGDYNYHPGRHVFSSNCPIEKWNGAPLVIMKFLWSPWPEMHDRKRQIGNRIPSSDVVKGFGNQHTDRLKHNIELERINLITKLQGRFDLVKLVHLDDKSFDIVTAFHTAIVPDFPMYRRRRLT